MDGGTTRYLLASEARRRWRSILAVTLLVAGTVAVVLASVAGAARTAGALDGYLADYRAPDLFVGADSAAAEVIATLDGVEDSADFELAAAIPVVAASDEFFPLVVSPDGAIPGRMLRAPVVAGRAADPSVPHEVVLSELTSRRLGLGVGDELVLATLTPETAARSQDFEEEPDGPEVVLDVVGIARDPVDIGGRDRDITLTPLTPAFARRYDGTIGDIGTGVLLRVADGALGDVTAAARRAGAGEIDRTISDEAFRAQAEPTVSGLATGLRVLALTIAIAGAVALAQVLDRVASVAVVDDAALASLGLGRGSRLLRLALPGAVGVVVGTGLGVAGAVAVSPLFPVGLARRASIDAGIDVDALVLGGGAAVALAVGLAVAAGIGVSALRPGTRAVRHSRLAGATARSGAGAPVMVGVGLATGRGARSSGAMRAAAVGAGAGVLGVVAALTYGASADHLVGTPRLYGWPWDATITGAELSDVEDDGVGRRLVEEEAFAAVAEVSFNVPITVDRRPALAVVIDEMRGEVSPTVVEGRAPETAGEIALGADLLEVTAVEVGDEVDVGLGAQGTLTVVGVVALPVTEDGGSSGVGALLTPDGAEALGGPTFCDDADSCFRNWGVVVGSGRTGTEALAPFDDAEAELSLYRPVPPAEVEQMVAIEHLPRLIAVILAVLAAIALVHSTVATVRWHRRDLGVLRAIGFTARQLRTAIAVQMGVISLVGVVFGAVGGVIVGRVVWRLTVDRVSVPFAPVVPGVEVALVVLLTLAIAQLAAIPSRRVVTRLRVGRVLTTE